VTVGRRRATRRSGPIDPLLFARGFVDQLTGELWWDDPSDAALNGAVVQSIVVSTPTEPLPQIAPKCERRPIDPLRLLPRAVRAYPAVEWRSVAAEAAEGGGR
jgi:hypothetical protein